MGREARLRWPACPCIRAVARERQQSDTPLIEHLSRDLRNRSSMARSDLLISLVKAGRHTSDPRFRSTVEAIIAEERAKHHTAVADQLSAALNNGTNGQTPGIPATSTVVGDLPFVREELRRVVEEHQRGELLRSYGMAPRHRLLLVGPPGNGKTSVAHGLAHDLMVPLLAVRYEGLIGSYLGETASRLRKVFDYARQRACVLFLDEFPQFSSHALDALPRRV